MVLGWCYVCSSLGLVREVGDSSGGGWGFGWKVFG